MYPSRIHVNSNYTSFFPDPWKPHLIPRQFTEAGYDCGLVGKLHLSDPINRREQGVEDLYSYVQLSTHPRDDWPPGKHEYVDWLRANGVDATHLLRAKQRPHRLIIPTPADDNVPPNLHQTFWCTEKSIEFIDQKHGARPWFLSVNPFDPHPPFDPPWEYYRRYKPEDLPGPHFQPSDLAHQREKMSAVHFQTHPESPAAINGQKLQAAYYAMVEHIDTEFGRLLDFLDSTGGRDNTIVIFASDPWGSLG
jgi:arylsulfatase